MPVCLTVARKEIRDHARDTRSLASTIVYALMGPAVVMLVSMSGVGAPTGRFEFLASMASVFALVTAFAGGMNLALDAMAGERERRSLLPLLLNPVTRVDVLIGKWIAANVFAVGAVALSVAGVCGVLALATSQPLAALVLRLSTWVWCGLVPLALLGSAVHLFVSAKSRSVKEAHSWLSMAVFVPMLAGMSLVFFPGWIGKWWFVTPIVGPQALIARTMAGEPGLLPLGMVLAAVTVAASLVVLRITGAVLSRDDVLVG